MSVTSTPSHLARAINFGLLVALAWLPFELSRVGGGDPGWVTTMVFCGLGVCVGAVIETEAYTVRRLKLAPFAAAHVFALGSFIATVPVSRNLFSGSFAATLPGASSAPYWLPMVAYLGLTWTIWAGIRVHRRLAGQPWGVGSALLLLTFAFFVEGSNRHLRPSEYPDVHTFCVVVVFIASYLALGQLASCLSWSEDSRRARWLVQAFLPALFGPFLFAGLSASALYGLQQPEDRLRLARDGQHSRWLVRSLRAAIDVDRDGFAQVFGGADCNDFDANISPNAEERLGNDVDENCDGMTGSEGPMGTGALASSARRDLLVEARQQLARWGQSDEVEQARAELGHPHLLLISVDALRADVFEDTPQNRADFPEFFALLDGSVRFDHSFAPAAGTDLSMSTLMTGHQRAFDPTSATLAEHLRSAGWYTSAVVPSEVLRYAGKTLLKRGFLRTTRLVNDAQEQDVGLYASSLRATKLALGNVDRYLEAMRERGDAAEPLALWVHYFDAHEHDELSPFDRQLRQHTTSRDPVERYRASVRLVDDGIGELRRGLQARGLWDEAVIVLVSDHGESLHEDARLPDNHGRVLYGALTNVPFSIRVPGGSTGRSQMPATLVDLMPTVLSLLGIEAQTELDGLDLSPELWSAEVPAPEYFEELSARPLAMYESEQRGVVQWPYKLLYRPGDRVYELFDLEADPLEHEDLAAKREALRVELAWSLSQLPRVELDRTTSGRRARELAARQSSPAAD